MDKLGCHGNPPQIQILKRGQTIEGISADDWKPMRPISKPVMQLSQPIQPQLSHNNEHQYTEQNQPVLSHNNPPFTMPVLSYTGPGQLSHNERSMGPSHERSMGQSHERTTGPCHERSMGPSHERSMGPSHQRSMGQSQERTIMGPSQERSMGPSHERPMGPSHERSMGPSHERSMGPSHERMMGPSHDRPTGPSHERSMGPSHVGPRHERPIMGSSHERPIGPSHERPMGPSTNERSMGINYNTRSMGHSPNDRSMGHSPNDRSVGISHNDRAIRPNPNARPMGMHSSSQDDNARGHFTPHHHQQSRPHYGQGDHTNKTRPPKEKKGKIKKDDPTNWIKQLPKSKKVEIWWNYLLQENDPLISMVNKSVLEEAFDQHIKTPKKVMDSWNPARMDYHSKNSQNRHHGGNVPETQTLTGRKSPISLDDIWKLSGNFQSGVQIRPSLPPGVYSSIPGYPPPGQQPGLTQVSQQVPAEVYSSPPPGQQPGLTQLSQQVPAEVYSSRSDNMTVTHGMSVDQTTERPDMPVTRSISVDQNTGRQDMPVSYGISADPTTGRADTCIPVTHGTSVDQTVGRADPVPGDSAQFSGDPPNSILQNVQQDLAVESKGGQRSYPSRHTSNVSQQQYTSASRDNQQHHQTRTHDQDTNQSVNVSKPVAKKHEVEFSQSEDFILGHFFHNRVEIQDPNQGTYSSWKPKCGSSSDVKICNLEDFIGHNDIQKALVISSCPLTEMKECLAMFPVHTQLTVVCHKEKTKKPYFGTDKNTPAFNGEVHFCSEHLPESPTPEKPKECDCDNTSTKRITLMNPPQSNQIDVNLLILRYHDSVKLVITTASLTTLHWRQMSILGWYCQLPMKKNESIEDESGKGLHSVQKDLSDLLRLLTLEPEPFLEGVDFTILSPHVQLIWSAPGDSHALDSTKKMRGLIGAITWPQGKQDTEMLWQTTNLEMLGHVGYFFLFPKMADSHYFRNLKIIYPSDQYAKNCVSNNKFLMKDTVKNIYQNNDVQFETSSYLYDLAGEQYVILNGQALRQEQKYSTGSVGWLMVGQAHCMASMKERTCHRLAVGLFPYNTETPEVITTHAFDLSKHNFPAYEADLKKQRCEDHALSVTGKASQMYRLYGKVARCKGRNLFVDELMHPVWQKYSDRYPRERNKQMGSVLLRDDVCEKCGLKPQNMHSIIIKFLAHPSTHPAHQNRVRASKILKMFPSEYDALVSCGENPIPPGIRCLPIEQRLNFYQQYEDGDKDADEQEEMMEVTQLTKIHNRHTAMKQVRDVDMPAMNPLRIAETGVWLEKHVRQLCGKSLPPFIHDGPYHAVILRQSMSAMRAKHFPGFA